MLHNQHPIPHSSFHFYRLVVEQKKCMVRKNMSDLERKI